MLSANYRSVVFVHKGAVDSLHTVLVAEVEVGVSNFAAGYCKAVPVHRMVAGHTEEVEIVRVGKVVEEPKKNMEVVNFVAQDMPGRDGVSLRERTIRSHRTARR